MKGMESLIEEYFGPMSGWNYVALMHFQLNNSGLHIYVKTVRVTSSSPRRTCIPSYLSCMTTIKLFPTMTSTRQSSRGLPSACCPRISGPPAPSPAWWTTRWWGSVPSKARVTF